MKSHISACAIVFMVTLVLPQSLHAAEPPPPITPKVIELKTPPSVNGSISAPTIKDNSVVPPVKEVILPKPNSTNHDNKQYKSPNAPVKPETHEDKKEAE